MSYVFQRDAFQNDVFQTEPAAAAVRNWRRRKRRLEDGEFPWRLDSAEFPFARGLQPTPEQLRLAARAAIPETVSPIPEAVLLPEPSNAVAELATRNRRNRALLIALAEAL